MLWKPVVVSALFWTLGGMIALNGAWLRGLQLVLIVVLLSVVGEHWFPFQKRAVWLKTGAWAIVVLAVSIGWNTFYDTCRQTKIGEAELKRLGEQEVLEAEGMIVSGVSVDGDRASFTLRLHRLAGEREEMHFPRQRLLKETVQVFIRLESPEQQLWMEKRKRGEILILQGRLEKPGEARNFGTFDYRNYLRWQGIHWVLEVTDLTGTMIVDSMVERRFRLNLEAWLGNVDRFREQWAHQIERLFPPDMSGWMKSMTVGMRNDLDPQLYEQFSWAGISHILAISGLHVGVFLAVILTLLTLLKLPLHLRIHISMLLLPFYIIFSGAAPPVLRAGIMAMIGLYTWKKNRLKNSLHIACLTGMILLIWNPYYLFHIGFQLSFIVTIGLILFVPFWNRLFPLRPDWLSNSVAVTSVAQIVSFPLTVYYFHHFSLLSWLANLLLVPLISFAIIPGTIAAVSLSFVHIELGKKVALAVESMGRFVAETVFFFNSIDCLHFHWPQPSPGWLVLYFMGWAALAGGLKWRQLVRKYPQAVLGIGGVRWRFWFHLRRHEGPIWLITLSCMILLGTFIYGYAPQQWQRTGEVHFIDVGQGDAALIRTPHNKTILVDGGGTMRFIRPGEEWRMRRDPFEVGKDVLVPLLKQRGVQRLDYIVISHLDHDHIGGLMAVLKRMPVERILFNGTLRPDDAVKELFGEALRQKIPLSPVKSGDVVKVDAVTELKFLYPWDDRPDRFGFVRWDDKQNENSVVFLMKMYDYTFLFTGDVFADGEREIIRRGKESGPVHVMKAAHHGSRTSTSETWLSFWQPRITVISAGPNNRYGHPHEEVLERLRRAESAVFRTDLHGEVQFRVYPAKLEMRTKRGEMEF